MAREIIFPEKMNILTNDTDSSIRTMDDYIRYMVERIDFAFTNYLTKDNYISETSKIADDIFAKNITATTINCDQLNGGVIRGQVIESKDGTFKLTADGALYASNAYIRGDIEATSISADAIRAIELDAAQITTGELNAQIVGAIAIDASQITSGTIDAGRIGAIEIDASQITSGTIDAARIGAIQISASQITSGTIDAGLLDATIIKSKVGISSTVYGDTLSIRSITISNDSASNGGLTLYDTSGNPHRLSAQKFIEYLQNQGVIT